MKLFLKIILSIIGIIVLYLIIFFAVRYIYILGATQGDKIDRSKNNKSMLLVIDMQEGLNSSSTLSKYSQPYINQINKVIEHSDKHKTVFITTALEKRTLISTLFLFDIALKGTKDENIDSRIKVNNPLIFKKDKADTFHNKEFEKYLNKHQIGRLYITGIAAEVCVNYTIQGALNRGYEVFVIKETIVPIFGEKSLSRMINKYESLGAKIISIDDYLKINK